MADCVNAAKQILEHVGGVDNINRVAHCATRLRINYKDKAKVDMEALKAVPGMAGVVERQGQVQVIVGPRVNDAYNDFLTVSGWKPEHEGGDVVPDDENIPHDAMYWMNKFGNFVAPVFMPIVPAFVVGGMILAIRTLLTNYFGVPSDSGTAQTIMTLYNAGFVFLPVYLGYSFAAQLKMQPIMGMMLGAVMICDRYTSGNVTDFLGIAVPQVDYSSSVIPIILGVGAMYWIDKGFKKIIPDALIYFLKPLLTMVIMVPLELIVLGPLGTELSSYVGMFFVWLMDTFGIIALPIMAVAQPYMVMLGLDKALSPISLELYANLGYNPLTSPSGFISNLCIGGAALAVTLMIKQDKVKRGMLGSASITALCGVTEPAWYGGLLMRPRTWIGVAIGAAVSGIVGGFLGLRTFTMGACPGLLTFLQYVNPENGDLHYVFVAAVVAVLSIGISFIATYAILKHDAAKGMGVEQA